MEAMNTLPQLNGHHIQFYDNHYVLHVVLEILGAQGQYKFVDRTMYTTHYYMIFEFNEILFFASLHLSCRVVVEQIGILKLFLVVGFKS